MPVLLTSGTVSAAATLDIVLTSYTAYRAIQFLLSGFRPATDDVELWCRFSTDGGSTYDAGAASYADSFSAADQTKIILASTGGTNAVGSASTEGLNGNYLLQNQTSTAFHSRLDGISNYLDAEATPVSFIIAVGGARKAAQDTDAVRFLFESGNIASGNYAVYGWK